MSTTTKNLLRAAATVAFAIAATATTVTSAMAQEAPRSTTTAPATVVAGAATATAAKAVTISGKQAPVKASTGLTREQVKAEVIEARKNGTLLQSEADFEAAFLRQQQAH